MLSPDIPLSPEANYASLPWIRGSAIRTLNPKVTGSIPVRPIEILPAKKDLAG
jgi:hypothetical protein